MRKAIVNKRTTPAKKAKNVARASAMSLATRIFVARKLGLKYLKRHPKHDTWPFFGRDAEETREFESSFFKLVFAPCGYGKFLALEAGDDFAPNESDVRAELGVGEPFGTIMGWVSTSSLDALQKILAPRDGEGDGDKRKANYTVIRKIAQFLESGKDLTPGVLESLCTDEAE